MNVFLIFLNCSDLGKIYGVVKVDPEFSPEIDLTPFSVFLFCMIFTHLFFVVVIFIQRYYTQK